MKIETHIRNRRLFKDLVFSFKSMKEKDAINKICIKYDLSIPYVEKLIRNNRKQINKLRSKNCPIKIKRCH